MLENWIGDKSIVTILQNDHNLDFVNERYINRHLPNISLNNYKYYNVRINKIINNDNNRTNEIFYHFTKATIAPKTLSTRLEWQKIYNNFRLLRSINSNKRKNLQDTTNTSSINKHTVEKQSDENTNKKS